MAIILLSTGFVIGVSSNGGDPTVDQYLGIFNFPWFNASEGVDAPNYYRNGQNYTAWVESISGVSDHGALTGLDDDDHSQYLLDSEDSGNFTTVEKGGVEIGTEERLNFIEGDGVTLTIVDDPANEEVDVTISAIGGGFGLEEYPFSYFVFANSTGTYAINGSTGEIEFSGVVDVTVINNALSHLTSSRTWLEIVVFRGIFEIATGTSISVGNWTIMDCYGAEFHKAYPDATTPILVNADQTNGNTMIRIYGGLFDGHEDDGNNGNENAKGIYINNNNKDLDSAAKGRWPCVSFVDVVVVDCYGNNIEIWLSAADAMKLYRCSSVSTFRIAFKLRAGDSYIESCNAGSYYENLWLEGGRFRVSDFYAGGTCIGGTTESAIYVNGDDRSVFVNVDIDYCQKHGIILNGVQDCSLVNVKVIAKNNAQTNNTYTAIRLQDSIHTTIESCSVFQYETDTWMYKYGIEETGTSNYNIIIGNDVMDVGTQSIVKIGANTIKEHNLE